MFLSLDEHYDEIAARVVTFPFAPAHRPLPFLSAEDLALFKLSFGRPKDWVDLQSLCRAGRQLDVAYIERQLLALRGPAMNPAWLDSEPCSDKPVKRGDRPAAIPVMFPAAR